MYSKCIENFLNKAHPNSADRYSDSSDFEIPSKYFRVAAKVAIHTTKTRNRNRNSIKQNSKVGYAHVSTQYCISSENKILINSINKSKESRNRNYGEMECKHNRKNLFLYNDEDPKNHYIRKSNGNVNIVRDHELFKPEKLAYSMTETEDALSSNSNNVKGNSFNKFQSHTKASNVKRYKCGKFCFHSKKIKKIGNDNRSYTISPVYVIERNENNSKNTTHNKEEILKQDVSVYCSRCCSTSFAESEKEIFRRSYRVLSSTVPKVHDFSNKSIPKENISNISSSPQSLLKRNASTLHRTSLTHASKSVSTDLKMANKLSSSSSAFWNYLSEKLQRKHSKKEDNINKCQCNNYNNSCHQDIIKKTDPIVEKQKSTIGSSSPDMNKYIDEINQTDFIGIDTGCQCNHGSIKLEILSEMDQSTINEKSNDIVQTKSQRKHEAIAKALTDKYNGEILCIHNPPCVLINGCLNMCPSNSGHSRIWPVITKRKGFGQKSKKSKPNKANKYDQSGKYQPSYSKLKECLPEFKMENVQNKRSPCQMFHCQKAKGLKLENIDKAKFDAKLLTDETDDSQQNANCTIPVCSKVYIVVNANESYNSYVCPHKPRCLMIPKCLARLISNNYVQVNSVPDCTHVPYCEKIPACFGKVINNAVRSEHSKSACHIV